MELIQGLFPFPPNQINNELNFKLGILHQQMRKDYGLICNHLTSINIRLVTLKNISVLMKARLQANTAALDVGLGREVGSSSFDHQQVVQ